MKKLQKEKEELQTQVFWDFEMKIPPSNECEMVWRSIGQRFTYRGGQACSLVEEETPCSTR